MQGHIVNIRDAIYKLVRANPVLQTLKHLIDWIHR